MSRNPERITPVLEALEEYWRANPDLRLGQIVSNALTYGKIYTADFITSSQMKLQNIQSGEEDEFLEGLGKLPNA